MPWYNYKVSERLNTIGGKAMGLEWLLANGFAVPWFTVLGANHLEHAIEQAGISKLSEVEEQVFDLELPASVQSWLRGLPDRPLIFRSSASVEDGADRSLAGQLRSCLVFEPDQRASALRHCWASLLSSHARAYLGEDTLRRVRLGIIAQLWVEPEASGVLFAQTDISICEAVFGRGEALVTGFATPDQYRGDGYQRVGRKQLALVPCEKTVYPADLLTVTYGGQNGEAYVLEPDPDQRAAYVLLPDSMAEQPALEPHSLTALWNLGERIRQEAGQDVDVEWVKDRDGRIWVVQCRPCTARVPLQESASQVFQVASPGSVQGPAYVCKHGSAIAAAPAGHILIAPSTSPEHTEVLLRVRGVVVEQGGLLSHTAIVCRELGIPCLVGFSGATDAFQTGQEVCITPGGLTAFPLEDPPGGQVYPGNFAGTEVVLQEQEGGFVLYDEQGLLGGYGLEEQLLNGVPCPVWRPDQPFPDRDFVLLAAHIRLTLLTRRASADS
ncbi:MAG: hypothetical protein C4321_06740 [Chloroflexota bacterium]